MKCVAANNYGCKERVVVVIKTGLWSTKPHRKGFCIRHATGGIMLLQEIIKGKRNG